VKVFVTGAAGFIGYHLSRRLLADGHAVTGYDGLTAYYDVPLKRRRLDLLRGEPHFTEITGMLEDHKLLAQSIAGFGPDVIIHLAAQAGVRYSVEHPEVYIQSNLVGTGYLLEVARDAKLRHLLLASSSSVYGGNTQVPFRESDRADWPVSLYGASKRANEVMSHSYAHLHGIPTTCLRFFTAYGPWGRPDMALFRFAEAIGRGKPIEVYGRGKMRRDFTYIDDLVEGIVRIIDVPPVDGHPVAVPGGEDSLSPVAPWRVVNMGGGRPGELMDLIEALEAALGRKAERRMEQMQAGDVRETWASPELLKAMTGYVPQTPIETGVRRFAEWYLDYAATA
jgi:UDP-glucuronate 4-epimerase